MMCERSVPLFFQRLHAPRDTSLSLLKKHGSHTLAVKSRRGVCVWQASK